MRPDALQPQSGSGPPRPRIGATLPIRLLGLGLLTLAITVPGCQALLYADTSSLSDLHEMPGNRAPAAAVVVAPGGGRDR